MSLNRRIRRYLRAVAAVAALSFALAAEGSAQAEVLKVGDGRTAKVRIVAIRDEGFDFGLDFKVESFLAQNGKTDLASRFGYGSGAAIPYGTYRASVYVPGFWGSALGIVHVAESDVLVVIDLRSLAPGVPRRDSNF